MQFLIAVLAFVVTIGLIILIHEGGHYFAAKRLGILVTRFSIGMGPVLWRRRLFGDEFAVSLLPVGGYVAFADRDTAPEGTPDSALFETTTRTKRAIVAAAGPLMNFVLAFFLYVAIGAIGTPDIAPYLASKPYTEAARAGIERMDRAVAVDGVEVEGVFDFNQELVNRLGERDVALTLVRRGTLVETTIDLSGIGLGDIAKTQGFVFPLVGLGLTGEGVLVQSVVEGGPAERAGLKAGDIIERVDGAPADLDHLMDVIRERKGGKIALAVRRVEENARFEFLNLVLEPRAMMKDGVEIGRADVVLAPGLTFITVRRGPLESIESAWRKVSSVTLLQATSVKGIADGSLGAENLSGPVGIASMAGAAATAGVVAFLDYLALISIAVGFMNLLPLPALDGGHLAVCAVEAAIRRDLPESVRRGIGMVGIALMLGLFILTTWNDLGRLFG